MQENRSFMSLGWEELSMCRIIQTCHQENTVFFYSLYGIGEMEDNLSSHAEACLDLKLRNNRYEIVW